LPRNGLRKSPTDGNVGRKPESLKNYQVSKIERIESMRDGRRSPNGLHILTFRIRTLPEHILCGYERFAVRQ
jgi:hypothetical protein